MSESNREELDVLKRELAERDAQIGAVRVISAALSQVTMVDELVQKALDVSLECVGAEAGSVILYDADKDRLIFRYVVGEAKDTLTGMEMEPDKGIAGAVFQSGEIDVSEDVFSRKEHARDVEDKIDYATKNMVTVPLLSAEARAIGVMQVLNKTEGIFDDADVAILDILASQIAAALETARLHEEARLGEIMRFVGNLSHDVKNMMTPIQTGAETLDLIAEDTWADVDRVVADAGDTGQDLQDATMMLRDLLPEMTEMFKSGCDAVQVQMAEVSAAVKGIVSEPTFQRENINNVVDMVVPMLNVMAQKQGVTLAKEVPEDIAPAVMDAKLMYNAIYNLINNALGACGDGTSITTRARVVSEGEFPDGAFLEVAVADTGSGMPEEVRRKLFTDDAVSTKAMGTGLGTKIVKNAVDAHDGIVWVESVMGEGTTITFRVPVDGSPEAQEAMRLAAQKTEQDAKEE